MAHGVAKELRRQNMCGMTLLKTVISGRGIGLLVCAAAFSLISLPSQVNASNVGGVFGPVVSAGDRTFQYRGAYDPDTEQFVQRVHYQQSLNDDVRLRGVLQFRRTDDSDLDFDFFQGEYLWQLKDVSKSWQHAVRFDVRIADGGRRGLAATTWTNRLTLSDKWSATALILGSVDVGPDSRSGLFLQTRANVSRKINDRWRVNAELFSSYGSTSDLLSFDEQVHQIGPAISGKLGNGWSVFSGALFGATDASPDESLRFWLTKGF